MLEIIGMSLNKLGYNLNDRNSHHLKEAERDLTKLAPQVRGVVGDEITMMLQQNEGNIAVVLEWCCSTSSARRG